MREHLEVSAQRRVAAEDASDGYDEANGEIQDSLLVRTAGKICALRLTRSCQCPGQARASRTARSFERTANSRLRHGQNRVMQNGLYVAVSAQVALQRRLETIADNVANMNTVGYRATGVSFEQEMARAGEAKLAYVSPGSDYLSRGIGGLVKTDNSLDFAVQGDGWLAIQTPSGVAYTRDGRARVDEVGNDAHAERRRNS